MYMGFKEEGDTCSEFKCEGILLYPPVENCSCHIHPPCSACVDNLLVCPKCGWEPDEPEYKMVSDGDIQIREYKPRVLDNTKIDYRIKPHSNSSQICEGVYPFGATKKEVEAKVKGTFGGRFEYFYDGKFSYVAYTD